MPFISAYKNSINDKVFYLRRDSVSENNIPRECFGRIISIKDIEETPYCYEAEFHVPFDGDEFGIERRVEIFEVKFPVPVLIGLGSLL